MDGPVLASGIQVSWHGSIADGNQRTFDRIYFGRYRLEDDEFLRATLMNTQQQQADDQHGDGTESVGSTSDLTNQLPDANSLSHESLITQVLEATLTSSGTTLTEGELESLLQVARAHPPHTNLQLGLVCELVSALLKTRFTTLSREHATLHHMSLRIAGSLWTHPRSQQQLIRFWELLSSDVRK